MNLTDWFPAYVKPARPGVYQQMCGYGRDLGYQHWDGRGWSGWHSSPSSAAKDPFHNAFGTEWRGLASDPNAKPDEQTDDTTGICEVSE